MGHFKNILIALVVIFTFTNCRAQVPTSSMPVITPNATTEIYSVDAGWKKFTVGALQTYFESQGLRASGRVYSIATVADTSTISSPYEGDIAIPASGASILFRGSSAWVQYFPLGGIFDIGNTNSVVPSGFNINLADKMTVDTNGVEFTPDSTKFGKPVYAPGGIIQANGATALAFARKYGMYHVWDYGNWFMGQSRNGQGTNFLNAENISGNGSLIFIRNARLDNAQDTLAPVQEGDAAGGGIIWQTRLASTAGHSWDRGWWDVGNIGMSVDSSNIFNRAFGVMTLGVKKYNNTTSYSVNPFLSFYPDGRSRFHELSSANGTGSYTGLMGLDDDGYLQRVDPSSVSGKWFKSEIESGNDLLVTGDPDSSIIWSTRNLDRFEIGNIDSNFLAYVRANTPVDGQFSIVEDLGNWTTAAGLTGQSWTVHNAENTSLSSANIILHRARGDAGSAYQPVAQGDWMGNIEFWGRIASGAKGWARGSALGTKFLVVADSVKSDNIFTSMRFYINPIGASNNWSGVEQFRMGSNEYLYFTRYDDKTPITDISNIESIPGISSDNGKIEPVDLSRFLAGLQSGNVGFDAGGNNFSMSNGGLFSWTTNANAGNWQYFTQANPLTNALNFYAEQQDSSQRFGLYANTIGLNIASISDIALLNDQVQQGLLSAGTYVAEFDEGGVLNYVPKSDYTDASNIDIADSGANFTATNVEDALTELADNVQVLNISGTTDGSGDLSPTHSFGSAPSVIVVTVTGTTFYHAQVHSKTSSNFKVRFFDSSGSAVTSTAVTADVIIRK